MKDTIAPLQCVRGGRIRWIEFFVSFRQRRYRRMWLQGMAKKTQLDCPEENSVGWIKNFMNRFSNPGELVVDQFPGTYETAEKYVDLQWHRRFAGCEFDMDRFGARMEDLVETYERPVLNEKSDNSGLCEVMDVCKTLVPTLEELPARKWMISWKVPVRLEPMHVLPSLIIPFFPNTFLDPSLFENERHISMRRRSPTGRIRFYRVKVELLLAV